MRFTQDFRQDLEQLLLQFKQGLPFAFVRYADGESAMCQGLPLHVNKPAEEWISNKDSQEFQASLVASLQANLPEYYLGISCPCCDPQGHLWFLRHATAPLERISYANLLVNANYARWMEFFGTLARTDYVLVSSNGGDYTVPRNAVNVDWGLEDLVADLHHEHRPIFVAAGPAAEVIIHRYWQTAPQKQIIMDVGSTLDPQIHGFATRAYHDRGSLYGKRICCWS